MADPRNEIEISKRGKDKDPCGRNNRVVQLFEALHGEEAAHGHAVVDEQLDESHAVHHQGIEHGLVQGVPLDTREIIQVRVDWSNTML